MSITEAEKLYAEEADKLETTQPNVPKPDWNVDDFFKQRDEHRKALFWFALIMSAISLVFLIVILGVQTYLRVKINPYLEVLSDQGMQIIAVAIFGQIFGVVYVIAHALWSNHEFHLMGNNKK